MFRKTSKLIGLFLILVLSFLYTDYVFNEARKNDPLMKEVVSYKKNHDKMPIEPKIKDDEIILGMTGLEVNLKESYKNMKKNDYFNKNKVVYNKTKPKNTISKNYSYYIKNGYPKKNYVYLIYKVKNGKHLDEVLKNISNKKTNITFFVDGSWLENNIDKAFLINNLNSEIYNLGYNGIYSNSTINITNNLIESITLKDSIFCLNEDKNANYKKICSKKKMYSILPTVSNPSLNELKQNLKKGIIISYDEDNFDYDLQNIIIKTIISRGYEIKPLSLIIEE